MPNPLYDTLFGRHAGSTDVFLYTADGGELSYKAFLEQIAQVAHATTNAEPGPAHWPSSTTASVTAAVAIPIPTARDATHAQPQIVGSTMTQTRGFWPGRHRTTNAIPHGLPAWPIWAVYETSNAHRT